MILLIKETYSNIAETGIRYEFLILLIIDTIYTNFGQTLKI